MKTPLSPCFLLITASITSVLLSSPLSAGAPQASVRKQASNKTNTMTVEYVADGVYHFELSSRGQETQKGSTIPSTSMVSLKSLAAMQKGDHLSTTQRQQIFDSQIKIDPETLCVTIKEKNSKVFLTQICPLQNALGLTLDSSSIQNVYGLGEQFLTPGQPNGDWNHNVRTPGSADGNAMVKFNGGFVGNAQFPIMYALGSDKVNYALFLDHLRSQTWNFKTSPYAVTTTGDILRWYVITGIDLPALRTKYLSLVGRPPVPPKKTWGLWVSEFGYRDWDDMKEKLTTLRAHHMPVDGFVLDLYWFGTFSQKGKSNHFGNVAWDTSQFPHPREKLDELARTQGIGVGLIEESYIDKHLPEYKTLSAHGYLVRACETCDPVSMDSWWGQGSMIDWTNPQAVKFWHDLKRQPLVADGVLLHWTDLGEPEDYTEKAWYSGGDGMGHHDNAAVHNFYNFRWIESIAEGYERHANKRRPFILSRSGTSGIQRFGAAMWSGDIGSNLQSLSTHLNAQMHLSLSGLDYFGCDVGGFHHEALKGDLNEVYTKWFAHSAAFDVPLRPHTDNSNKLFQTAPDRIGDLKSNTFNLRQRYELSPYYYSLSHRAYLFGEPVMPPLVYYYQQDLKTREIGDEKLVGRDLLFATGAVLGQTQRDVYLPEGTWIDYHTQKWYVSTDENSGRWAKNIQEFENGIYRLPLFMREGAIIPKMHVDDQTMNILGMRLDGSKRQELILNVATSKNQSEFTLFEDDGETIGYKNHALAQTLISQITTPKQTIVVIEGTKGNYLGALAKRRYVVELVTQGSHPSEVVFNGKPLLELKSELPKKMASPSTETSNSMKVGWRQVNSNLVVAISEVVGVKKRKSFVFRY